MSSSNWNNIVLKLRTVFNRVSISVTVSEPVDIQHFFHLGITQVSHGNITCTQKKVHGAVRALWQQPSTSPTTCTPMMPLAGGCKHNGGTCVFVRNWVQSYFPDNIFLYWNGFKEYFYIEGPFIKAYIQ